MHKPIFDQPLHISWSPLWLVSLYTPPWHKDSLTNKLKGMMIIILNLGWSTQFFQMPLWFSQTEWTFVLQSWKLITLRAYRWKFCQKRRTRNFHFTSLQIFFSGHLDHRAVSAALGHFTLPPFLPFCPSGCWPFQGGRGSHHRAHIERGLWITWPYTECNWSDIYLFDINYKFKMTNQSPEEHNLDKLCRHNHCAKLLVDGGTVIWELSEMNGLVNIAINS